MHNKLEPCTSLLCSVARAPAAAAVNNPHFVGLSAAPGDLWASSFINILISIEIWVEVEVSCRVICGQVESHRKPIPETYRESDAFNAVHGSYEVVAARALLHLTSYSLQGSSSISFYRQTLCSATWEGCLQFFMGKWWGQELGVPSETSVAALIPG